MVAFSGSVAEAVAIVVPVEMFSAKELEATEVDKVAASLMLLTEKTRLLVAVLLPSEAVKVKL